MILVQHSQTRDLNDIIDYPALAADLQLLVFA
jgi:hypothetical protein